MRVGEFLVHLDLSARAGKTVLTVEIVSDKRLLTLTKSTLARLASCVIYCLTHKG
jgi:hypothetical protein